MSKVSNLFRTAVLPGSPADLLADYLAPVGGGQRGRAGCFFIRPTTVAAGRGPRSRWRWRLGAGWGSRRTPKLLQDGAAVLGQANSQGGTAGTGRTLAGTLE